jgi:hypothetical protein
VLVVLVVLAVGVGMGVAVSTVLWPDGMSVHARARAALRKDTADELARAAALAEDEPELVAVGALAHVLRWLDHGAPDTERQAAERKLLLAPPAVRATPEGLYARALLAALPPSLYPPQDATLEADLAATTARDPWVELARALRAPVPERQRLLERAAFASSPPSPHATYVLSRWMLAQGDVAAGQAVVERLLRLSSDHVPGLATALAFRLHNRGAVRTRSSSDPSDRSWRNKPWPEETRALRLLERASRGTLALGTFAIDPLDEQLLHLIVWVAALARQAPGLAAAQERALTATTPSRSLTWAERFLELAIVEGKDAVVDALVARLASVVRPSSLRVDKARAHLLSTLPPEERLAPLSVDETKGTGTSAVIDASSDARAGQELLRARWGILATVPTSAAATSVLHDVPWVVRFDPLVFPERRLAFVEWLPTQTAADLERLDASIALVDLLARAERAFLARRSGEARALVEQARQRAPDDVEGLLLLVRMHIEDGQRTQAQSLLALVEKKSPAPWQRLVLARLALAVDEDALARRSLDALRGLGIESSTADALRALLEARANDAAGAAAALEAAQERGAGDDVAALQARVLVGRTSDVDSARAAASLLAVASDPPTNDVVAAWIAEARYRAGQQPAAESLLRALVERAPGLGDAHLFLARAIAFDPARREEALTHVRAAAALLEGTPLGLEAEDLARSLRGPER